MKKVWTYLVIAFIALLASVNYELFVFPNQFAPSGINGICTMIQYVTGVSVGYLSLLINIPLAIWCYIEVSKPMAIRSMVYVVTFSLGLLILDKVDLSAFAYVTENGTSKILGPMVAGVIQGFVYSILIKASAYTGGTDFISAIVHKHSPNRTFFGMSFAINCHRQLFCLRLPDGAGDFVHSLYLHVHHGGRPADEVRPGGHLL